MMSVPDLEASFVRDAFLIDIYLQCTAVRARKAYGFVFFVLEIHCCKNSVVVDKSQC